MQRQFTSLCMVLLGLNLLQSCWVFADIKTEKIFNTDLKKTNLYRKEGLVVGGDRTLTQVVVKDIRWASHRDQKSGVNFERVVIDLKGTRNGEPLVLESAPYYEVAVQPAHQRMVVSLWGNPQLAFDSKKVEAAFKKGSVIRQIQLLPKVEDSLWTFSLNLKEGSSVEVFELRQPVRLIVDIKWSQKAPLK